MEIWIWNKFTFLNNLNTLHLNKITTEANNQFVPGASTKPVLTQVKMFQTAILKAGVKIKVLRSKAKYKSNEWGKARYVP